MYHSHLFVPRFFQGFFLMVLLLVALSCPALANPVAGAIFTTNSTCDGTNINLFADKQAVYLDGGPTHPGAAGLPDGFYYVQVTAPDGTLLGTSVYGESPQPPVEVVNGEFLTCYQLWSILFKASNGEQGYDDTPNPGGEYKVWASQDFTFTNDETKTDNFKVRSGGPGDPEPPEPAELGVLKFYDADADGQNDAGEPLIVGWKIHIMDGIDYIRYTPVVIYLDPDIYTVSEFLPVEPNWMATTPTSVSVTLSEESPSALVEFGNVCLGAGGGLTLGFWSNKNGQALIGLMDLAALSALNLRNAEGTNFDTSDKKAFRTWILSATAENMAYMLSAQMAAMDLNVWKGFVNGDALIYAPGVAGANSLGFATVNQVLYQANYMLGLYGTAYAGDPWRAHMEALKNALDAANNNTNFVQSTPCPFTFAE